MRTLSLLVAAVAVAGIVTPVPAQMDPATAQKKLLSRRAAEADAYRKLSETIRGLQITSDTHVQDFVAESDEIRAGMDTFIRGVRLGQPRWDDDLACQVPAEVTVQKVVETLQELHQRYYKGDKIKAKDFEHIDRQVQKKVIRAVGMGAPREDLPPDLPEGVVQQLGGPPIPPQPKPPLFWKQVIGPQGTAMALRAAELDAKRKLLERIKGLRITSNTQVRDFVAESDRIDALAQGTIIGATIVSQYLHADEPIAEVTVEVPVESVIECIKELHSQSIKGHRVKGSDITEIARSIKSQTFQATGMGIPPPESLHRFNVKAKNTPDELPPWAVQPIRAAGNGVPPPDKTGTPQGRLLAARAAELDAKRHLAEEIHGLRLSARTTVQDFVATSDEIRAQVDTVLIGASVERTTFDGDTATVVVVLPGMAVWDVLHDQMRVAENAPPPGGRAPMRPGAMPPPGPGGQPAPGAAPLPPGAVPPPGMDNDNPPPPPPAPQDQDQ